MRYVLGLTTATATYQPFACPTADYVQLTVVNAAVSIDVGTGTSSPQWRNVDSFRVPGVHTIPGPLDAIRVRAAGAIVAGREPRYAIDAY